MQYRVYALAIHGGDSGVLFSEIGDLGVLSLRRHGDAARPKRISALLEHRVIELARDIEHEPQT